jgi:predicted outer membrane repeat protein
MSLHRASFLTFAFNLIVLCAAVPALAATDTVTTLADDGSSGTLRSVLAAAASGDTIVFQSGLTGTIMLNCSSYGQIILTQNVTISGPGASSLAISGNHQCQVLNVRPGVTASISGVTIENGSNNNGAGIQVAGSLSILNCFFSGNSAGVEGGAIITANASNLTISNSTFSGNSAVGGGAIFNSNTLTISDSTFSGNSAGIGGAIYSGGNTTISNSTFSGNSATGGSGSTGGAIYKRAGTFAIVNSTLTGNVSPTGAGIYVNANFSAPVLKSTLLAGQIGGPDCSGAITSDGYNLDDDGSCGFNQTGDQSDVTSAASFLGPLANNGGPTQTIALLTGSTAIDAIPLSACTDANGNPVITDQRGITRPQGATGNCDIGAFELQQTPTANVCPNGQTSPRPCSYPITLQYYVPSGTTLGTNPVKVVTQGATGLDFQQANGGSTCTSSLVGPAYCMVQVTFAPIAPGVRMGGATLSDNNGNVVAQDLISGIGQGSAVAFGPGTQSTIPVGLSDPIGVAVDAAGDVFVTDNVRSLVVKVPAGGGAPIAVGSELAAPTGVAVDGAGNVFVAGGGQVVEIPAGCSSALCQTTVGSGLLGPFGVAVDGAGDVFIADSGNRRVVEVPANGPQTTVGSGLSSPTGVAVDAAGDVFIADPGLNEVVEVPAGCASVSCQTTVDSALSYPSGLTVDAAGDVFIADEDDNRVVELPAGCTSSACQILVGGLSGPTGVAVDGAGDLFIANFFNAQVLEVNRSQAPSLSFASTSVGQTSSPQSVTVQNIGNELLNAVAPGLVVSGPNFVEVAGTGTPVDCEVGFAAAPLVPGANCNLSISFEPHSGGTLTGTAVFTDSALNAQPSATQTINLQGIAPAQVIASPGSLNFGSKGVGGAHPMLVAVENQSGGKLTIGTASITSTGGDPNAFSFFQYCEPRTLKAGAKCYIGVTFRPHSAGLSTGMLNVPFNGPGSPLEVPLMGTGVSKK